MPLVQLANGPLSATGPAAEVELDEIDLGYVLTRFKFQTTLKWSIHNPIPYVAYRMSHIMIRFIRHIDDFDVIQTISTIFVHQGPLHLKHFLKYRFFFNPKPVVSRVSTILYCTYKVLHIIQGTGYIMMMDTVFWTEGNKI